MRYALAGGAPVPPELVRRVESALGVPLVITFAQTEAHCSITHDAARRRAARIGPRRWVGRFPDEVKIADLATGEPAAAR